jgi:hypothetical protein
LDRFGASGSVVFCFLNQAMAGLLNLQEWLSPPVKRESSRVSRSNVSCSKFLVFSDDSLTT